MIYEAPYSAWYVSGAGNTLQLLNLWDATPEPPRFGGDIAVFETSLVDGTRAFAEGLGSAVEHRTLAFYLSLIHICKANTSNTEPDKKTEQAAVIDTNVIILKKTRVGNSIFCLLYTSRCV